jgi:hypothetical protein
MRQVYVAGLTAALVTGCAPRSLPVHSGEAHHSTSVSQAANGPARLLPGHMTINGVEGARMAANAPAEWEFRFIDPQTGQPIQAFEMNHDKAMHLVVVSQDLSSFAHLHPELLQAGGGRFKTRANAPSNDLDNQDAARAVTKPGGHLVFAEVVPKGESPRLAGFSLLVDGTVSSVPLKPDAALPDGSIRKFFTADGREGEAGAPYQVTLTVTRGEHHPGMPSLTFAFKIQQAIQGRYEDVRDLSPWLGMPGHALIIGQRGTTPQEKVFRHLHAGGNHGQATDGDEHGGHGGGHAPQTIGPDVSFMAMGDDVPPADVYKLWGQFKHQGRIVTFPFVLRL